VAIDQAYQRRQEDAEGEFYRKLAGQGPRNDFERTTQGLYIGTAGGRLLAYNNNRGPDRIRRLMHKALEDYEPEQPKNLESGEPDPRYVRVPPQGGLVVRVNAKVLGGYEESDDRWRSIHQTALSRDNYWITGREHRELAAGRLPDSVMRRLVRFHLIDNTRGEPPMWRDDEIRVLAVALRQGGLSGTVHLRTESGDRGYECQILGVIETKGDRVTRFDVVAKGDYWGHGRYTQGPPPGKFPFAVAFRLADGTDIADGVPPQGSRGWLKGYIPSD